MKKIAILTPFVARGGLEKVAVTQADLLKNDYEVNLIIMDRFIQDYYFDGKCIDLNVSLESRGIFYRIRNILESILKLRRLKKEEKYDLVISHGELANIPNIFSGGNCIVNIHENRFNAKKDFQGKIVNKIIKFLYTRKNVKKIVTVSEGIKEDLNKNIKIDLNLIHTIYNPFSVEEITLKKSQDLDKYKKIFTQNILITVGRFTHPKGYWNLIKIFSLIKKQSNYKLVLLGDGVMRDDLIKLSKSFDLEVFDAWSNKEINTDYDIYFLGFQDNPYKFLHASKVFIMTSLWEGLSNVLIESLFCNIPLISTDCKSGPSEILEVSTEGKNYSKKSKYGLLLPAFNSKEIDFSTNINSNIEKYTQDILDFLNDEEDLSLCKQNTLERALNFEYKNIKNDWIKLLEKEIL